MKLNCDLMEAIQRDFNSLWRCEQRGDTLEISVPYLQPDSTLLSLFITHREGRFIVCDGGGIMDILSEYCSLPEFEAYEALRDLANKFSVKEGAMDGKPLFFKDCTEKKLISSLAFDVANFATMATSALVSSSNDELAIPVAKRFVTRADQYVKSVKPPELEFGKADVEQVPGFRFSAVLTSSNRIWLISYISGSNHTNFRKNVNDTAKSFKHAWESRLGMQIARTIPFVNDEASGYDPNKLQWQIGDLQKDSRGGLLKWSERTGLSSLLRTSAPRVG